MDDRGQYRPYRERGGKTKKMKYLPLVKLAFLLAYLFLWLYAVTHADSSAYEASMSKLFGAVFSAAVTYATIRV